MTIDDHEQTLMIDRDCSIYSMPLGTEPHIGLAIHSLFLTLLLEHFYPVASLVKP